MKFIETGVVEQIKDGIVTASGLDSVGYNELVEIETGAGVVRGLALSLEEGSVGIVALESFEQIKEGDRIKASGELLSVEVSEAMIGNVVDALGNSIEQRTIKHTKDARKMPLEKIAPGVSDRQDVGRPLQTGIKSIDAMIPIGKGQRELIIGDRQTGKTAIAIDTILNQKGKDVICVYVGIGQKSSKISQIRSKLELEGAMEYSIIVAANASDAAASGYIAPYTGTAIAEYFAEAGKDVLIVYDDLSKHAWAYREISLLLRRPPGREAYPGDVFYQHSRLLERSVQYSEKKGGGSITALPIIETQAGDISAYIPTNVISITDGQIFLEAEQFNAGKRPAVNVGLSVSRVGGAAQTKAMKQVAGQLRLDLAQFRELAAFAQFGSDLDKETQAKIDRGKRIEELLKQNQYDPMSVAEQVMVIFAATKGMLDGVEVSDVQRWEEQFRLNLKQNHTKLIEKLNEGPKIEEALEAEMTKVIEATL